MAADFGTRYDDGTQTSEDSVVKICSTSGGFEPPPGVNSDETPKGSIAGSVYLDTNANHAIDSTDTFLPGVTVTLGGASSASQSSTSGPAPAYKFSDLALANYTVSAPPQAFGYALSSSTAGTQSANLSAPNNDVIGVDFLYEPASLSGTIYLDKDDNGVISGGDEILNGVQVDLTSATNASTTANGSAAPTYKFLGLQGGPYSVAVAGTFNGYKLATATASPKTGSLTAGGSVTDVNFLYVRGRLSGYAYVDSDNDGIKDAGEAPLAGVTITVTGLPATTTDATGYYSFKGLAANTYNVSASTPASGYALSTTSPLPANVAAGDDVKDVNFGYRPGGLSGFAYVDANRNSVKDASEAGLSGVVITLAGGGTATTNSTGAYSFSNLVANTYSLAAPGSAAGYAIFTTNPLSTPLAAGGSVANLNFGYVPGSISGFTYLDTNKNGVKDGGEPPLANVVVTRGSGTTAVTATSNASGYYEFTNLQGGTYDLTVPNPAFGYSLTVASSNTNPRHPVLSAGGAVTNVNFGYKDVTAPVCAVYATSWGGTMTFQDNGSGIKYLDVTKNLNNNFNVQISPSPSSFNPSVPSQPYPMPTGERGTYSTPTTQLITVTATRRNTSQSAQLIMNATDVFGNVITCDPVLTTVTKLRNDNGIQTFTDIPFDEHNVTIENNTPGLRGMDVIVNGVEFRVRGMEDGEVRELNVRRAMRRNNTNTITLIPRGRRGESADVTIAAPDWEE